MSLWIWRKPNGDGYDRFCVHTQRLAVGFTVTMYERAPDGTDDRANASVTEWPVVKDMLNALDTLDGELTSDGWEFEPQ